MKNTIVILSLLAGLFLGSCGPLTPKQPTAKVVAIEKKAEMIFDVPFLLNKNIDEIKKILGKPTSDTEPTKLQIQMGIDEWDKTFAKNGYELLVRYNPKTRKVIDIFIGTNDPSGASSYFKDLLQVTNTEKESPSYMVRPVSVPKNPSTFTGVVISSR